jgi:hypothetical protein
LGFAGSVPAEASAVNITQKVVLIWRYKSFDGMFLLCGKLLYGTIRQYPMAIRTLARSLEHW